MSGCQVGQGLTSGGGVRNFVGGIRGVGRNGHMSGCQVGQALPSRGGVRNCGCVFYPYLPLELSLPIFTLSLPLFYFYLPLFHPYFTLIYPYEFVLHVSSHVYHTYRDAQPAQPETWPLRVDSNFELNLTYPHLKFRMPPLKVRP